MSAARFPYRFHAATRTAESVNVFLRIKEGQTLSAAVPVTLTDNQNDALNLTVQPGGSLIPGVPSGGVSGPAALAGNWTLATPIALDPTVIDDVWVLVEYSVKS